MKKTIVSFGEIMLRLTPPSRQLIKESRTFDANYGGSESNVLVCLSCLGSKTDYLTALPLNSLGDAAVKHLRSNGVGTEHILRQGENIGMYFMEEGYGDRLSTVIYHRKNSEVSKLDENAFDYEKIFKDCSVFHLCGISFALSESAKSLCFRLLSEARKRNITVSFDFNYRAKLWNIETAAAVYRQIVDYVDILFCSERDLKTFLHTDKSNFHKQYPCRLLVVRERSFLPDNRCATSVCAIQKVKNESLCYAVDSVEFPILERIGSGDAFVGGVLHILNADADDIQNALRFGLACYVLKHTQKGDVFTLGSAVINKYINETSKDVSR